jgi:hypothetical protein
MCCGLPGVYKSSYLLIPSAVCAFVKPEKDVVYATQPEGRKALTAIFQLSSAIDFRAVIQSFEINSINLTKFLSSAFFRRFYIFLFQRIKFPAP